MSLDSVLKFLDELNLLAEVTENGDLQDVNNFVVKYLKGSYFEERNDAIDFIQNKYFDSRFDKKFMVYTDLEWNKYHFWEDLNGKFIKDLRSWSTLYPPALVILDEYYGIYD